MKSHAGPLTDEELDALDRFLLDRIDEDEVTEGADEGIFEISGLDGFMTAIVSGPVAIMPSQWLPAVWGDFEPEWKSIEEAERILSLMMRHMNDIAGRLITSPGEFAPLYYERKAEGETFRIVDEWCEGYVRGVSLAADAWAAGGPAVTELLAPIRAFTEAEDWPAHEAGSREEVTALQEIVMPSAAAIHAYWLERRVKQMPSGRTPVSRTEPRVGRNDPCPCGSGKKFKRCCLN